MLRGGHPVVEEDVELHTLELDNEDTTESYHYSADEKLSEELSSFSREDEPDTTFIDWEVQAGGTYTKESFLFLYHCFLLLYATLIIPCYCVAVRV